MENIFIKLAPIRFVLPLGLLIFVVTMPMFHFVEHIPLVEVEVMVVYSRLPDKSEAALIYFPSYHI